MIQKFAGLLIAALAGLGVWFVGRDAEASDDIVLVLPEDTEPEPEPEPVPSVSFLPQVPSTPPGMQGGLGGTASEMAYPWQTEPPPNFSGDPLGYSTELFPDSLSVRRALDFLGYDMPIVGSGPAPAKVAEFQRDWNQASADGFGGAVGYLDDDGVPGKHTLSALGRAAFGPDGSQGLDDLPRGIKWASHFGIL